MCTDLCPLYKEEAIELNQSLNKKAKQEKIDVFGICEDIFSKYKILTSSCDFYRDNW